ncbi:hypothetical protein ACFXDF_36505 [Streptomyces sp. NPDC059426]|uniref:hypothetical protein n=1 Tax=Streptomyces sp. NPDC059426 TaxID=3346827 RepID=UPI0036C0BBCA
MTLNAERPRAESGAFQKVHGGTDPTVARQMGGWSDTRPPADWPECGSDEWHDLDTRDPRKRLDVFEAAERWSQQKLRQQWLDGLGDADWYAAVSRDAGRMAAQTIAATNRIRSFREAKNERAKPHPPHQLRAPPGWPAIRIPGGNGAHRIYEHKYEHKGEAA